jgi:hypothetical protein
MAGLSLVALASVALAAYSVFSPAPTPAPKPHVLPVQVTPASPPGIVYSNGSASANPAPGPQDVAPQAPPPVDTTPPYLKKRDRVVLDDVSLSNALALVTADTGLKLIVAPGFVDQKISRTYRNMSPVEVIRDMARQYAFTVSDEGDGTYLVIPVPDTAAPPKDGTVPTRKDNP